MEERCHTCGDIGVEDAIITCDKCKSSRQHLYCMRVVLHERPTYWCCETCEDLVEIETSSASCTVQELPRMSSLKTSGKVQLDPRQSADPGKFRKPLSQSGAWEKRVEFGKAKYLPVQEVLKLSSGSKPLRSPVKSARHCGPVSREGTSVRTPVKPPPPPMKFSFLQNPVNRSGKSLVQAFPTKRNVQRLLPGNVFMNITEGGKTERRVEKETISQAPLPSSADDRKTERRVEKEITSRAPLASPAAGTNTERMVEKGIVPQAPLASSVEGRQSRAPLALSSRGLGTGVYATLEQKISDAVKVNREISQSIVDVCYGDPAREASWKGTFKILDKPKYEGLCEAIQAHPACKVWKKVYDFSTKMPELLRFEVIPRGNLFRDRCPEKDDIGLFFFPCRRERSENYYSLLEFLGTEDLMMRVCIFNIELLVFTSKLLPSDSQRCDGECFLWGLCRRVKGGGKQKVADMEVDMVAGKHVGIPDVPIPKEPIRKGPNVSSTASSCGFSKTPKLGANDSPASAQPIKVFERNKSSRGARTGGLPTLSVKTEPQGDIPPGFENTSAQPIKVFERDKSSRDAVTGGLPTLAVKTDRWGDVPPGFENTSAQPIKVFERNKSSRGAVTGGLPTLAVKTDPWGDVPPGFENTPRFWAHDPSACPRGI